MKPLGCRHAEAARAMAIVWRDHGPAMGGVSDKRACRQRMQFHAERCARFLRVRANRSFAHGRPQAAAVATGEHFSS